MAYAITPEQLAVTDVEMAFGTTRLLAPWNEIPEDFKKGNLHTQIAEAIFYGTAVPEGEINFKPGFDPDTLRRALTSSRP